MKSTLIMMMGPAGCGKSHLAKKIEDTHEDCIIVSRDDIRFALLKPGEEYFAHEKEVERLFYQTISDMLLIHKYVIADATHVTSKSRNRFFDKVKIPSKTKTIGVWVEADETTAQKQNETRTGLRKVPSEAISRMYKYKVSPTQDEPFDDIIYISAHTDQAISTFNPTVGKIIDRLAEI